MGCICDKEEEEASITYTQSVPHTITHGCASYKWVKCFSGSSFPENAVRGGEDIDGTIIFVGKALHCGETLPAKVIPEKCVAYVSYDGEEHAKSDYEVTCCFSNNPAFFLEQPSVVTCQTLSFNFCLCLLMFTSAVMVLKR